MLQKLLLLIYSVAPHWILTYWILQWSQTLEQWCHNMPKQAFLKQEYFTSLFFYVPTTLNLSDLFPPFWYKILLFVPISLYERSNTEFHSHLFPLPLFVFHNILLFYTNHRFDFASKITSYVWPSLSLFSSSNY